MPPRSLRCPECDARFTPDPEDAGRRRVRCPDCGAMVPNVDGGGRRPRKSGGSGLLVVFGILGLVALGCCGGIGGLFWWAVGPTSFPEPASDYADARKGFQTTLVTKGPAPQTWEQVTPPPGVRQVQFTSSGGLALTAWVDPPPADGKKPAVLFLHGGFAFGAEDWDQAKPFRDAGFVTMLPILRGENGQPGNFTMFYDEVDDVVAAAEVLAKTPGVDPNRVYVAGHSAGGTLAMLGAMASPRFKACASFSGSPDQVAFGRANDQWVVFNKSDPREYAMRSPLAYYQSFKCPARLYYGDEELAFKFSTKKLAEKATAAGADVRAVEVPGDHFTAADPAIRQAITFFQSK